MINFKRIINTSYVSVIIILLFAPLQYIYNPWVGPYFWTLIFLLSLGVIFALDQENLILMFYLIFLIFVVFFGYYVQKIIGIRFLLNSSKVAPFNFELFKIIIIHLIGIFIGTIIVKKRISSKYGFSNFERLNFSNLSNVIVSTILVAGFVIMIVGLRYWIAGREERYNQEMISSTLYFFIILSKLSPYIVSSIMLHQAIVRKKNFFLWLVTSVIIFISILVSNPFNTARYICLSGILLVILVLLSSIGKIKNLGRYILILPLFLIVFLPITSMLRHGFKDLSVPNAIGMFSSLEFSNIQLMLDGLDVIDKLDNNYTITGLFIVVPHYIWAEKAGALGENIAEISGYVFYNAAVPSFFNPFVDYGFIGLFVFSLISGYMMKKLKLRNYINWKSRKDIYPYIFFVLIPIYARGDFSTFMIILYASSILYELFRFMSLISLIKMKKRENYVETEK